MKLLKEIFAVSNQNEENRQRWLRKTLAEIPAGTRILDAGAGELRNRRHCNHLKYVSQDFCKYNGVGNGNGLQKGKWDTDKIDIVCDIEHIPEPDGSFDSILCSEVLEHIPNPSNAIFEFARLLKPGGKLILTAPFASLVHFAPYYFCSGFSKYWYAYHLKNNGFTIIEITANGDWFTCCQQEIVRLRGMSKAYGDRLWLLAYIISGFGMLYFRLRKGRAADDIACFGYHCIATRC